MLKTMMTTIKNCTEAIVHVLLRVIKRKSNLEEAYLKNKKIIFINFYLHTLMKSYAFFSPYGEQLPMSSSLTRSCAIGIIFSLLTVLIML